jgi:hypothetical protein
MQGVEHKPTDEARDLVKRMVMAGIPQENIARVVGIALSTLHKYYREELDTAADQATAQVARTLFAKATDQEMTGPSVTAAIFWLKTRAGWRETDRHEITGGDGGPIEHSIAVDWIKPEKH